MPQEVRPQTFRLDTGRTSLILASSGDGVPRLVHWGPRLADDLDIGMVRGVLTAPILASIPDPPPLADEPPALSMFPDHGLGFFGQPALLGSRQGRDFVTALALQAVDAEEHALRFRLEDKTARLELGLELRLDPTSDLLLAHTTLTNHGEEPYDLQWLAALALRLPENCGELMTLGGRWAGEFHTARYDLRQPCQLERTSRYGRTGHGSSPTLIIGTPGFDDLAGEVMGLHLGWSGNHRVLVEVRRDGSRQTQLGEWLLPGELALAPGQTVRTPTVFAAWSNEGLNGLSHAFHTHLREQLLPKSVAARPRPVILNTWEAVYFDHDPEALKAIAAGAADLGVERFVLDDGWFGRRDSTKTSLGDWSVDSRKYPEGLAPLIDHVRGLGMEFGLWIEPEMISPESDLYARHPDWCLHIEGLPRPTHRSQLTLDLTRPEVSEHLFERLDALLRAHAIAYLKWDHNRDLAPAASAGVPAARNQTLAVYALFDRLRAAHPQVEIESCAAGGARIDFGIAARAERFWTSDNNDPIERLTIQRGLSLLFPLEVTGAHIGAVPSHQTGRITRADFRARTALFGHLGLELDPRRLSDDEKATITAHIALYKRFRSLLHTGRLHRFGLGDASGLGQIIVAADGAEALAQLVRLDQAPFAHSPPVRLPGLDVSARYRLDLIEPWPEPAASHLANPAFWRASPVIRGDALAEIGLRLPLALPETIWLLHLARV